MNVRNLFDPIINQFTKFYIIKKNLRLPLHPEFLGSLSPFPSKETIERQFLLKTSVERMHTMTVFHNCTGYIIWRYLLQTSFSPFPVIKNVKNYIIYPKAATGFPHFPYRLFLVLLAMQAKILSVQPQLRFRPLPRTTIHKAKIKIQIAHLHFVKAVLF
jgi:hypothetical protein